MRAPALVLTTVLVAGCVDPLGGPGGNSADKSAPAPSSTSPFQQIPDNGGPVLAAPSVVAITFDDDPDADELQAFASWIVGSSWLDSVAAEYGIGHGTSQRVDLSAVTGAVADRDVQAWLRADIASGKLPAPGSPDAPQLYVWFLGAGAAMTDPSGACTGGYHGEITIGGRQVPYAVVPRCPDDTYETLTPLQYREGRASHELVEAFTDPFPNTAPGYYFDDNAQVWTSTFGEVGDVCVWNYLPFAAGGHSFYAQRTWSNAAAAAGGDPCVPRPSGLTYFNVTATPAGVIHARPGATVTVQLDGWTTGAHAAWPIYALPSAWTDFDAAPSLSAAQIGDGDMVTLALQVPASASSGQHASVEIDSDDGQTNALWPVAVEVE